MFVCFSSATNYQVTITNHSQVLTCTTIVRYNLSLLLSFESLNEAVECLNEAWALVVSSQMFRFSLTFLLMLQVHVLQSLGIQSALFTDGHSPVNLFQTAKGLAPVI